MNSKKYDWYKEENYPEKDGLFGSMMVDTILKKFNMHPNDFKSWGDYLKHLSSFSEQVEQERLASQ